MEPASLALEGGFSTTAPPGKSLEIISNLEKMSQIKIVQRIPRWSSGLDLALSLLWAQVRSLVGELRFHKPFGAAKK